MSIFGKPLLTGVGKGSASGAVASFSDGAKGLPLRSINVNIDPVQDLHGYDNPWPAGGGKNKLPLGTKASETISGVTAKLDDGVITLSGTATADTIFVFPLITSVDLSPSTNKIAFLNSVSNVNVALYFMRSGTSIHFWAMSPANRVGSNWTDTGNEVVDSIWVQVKSGAEVSMTVSPMLIAIAETNYSYAPYSNICPISGWSALNVWRTGSNVWDEEWENGSISTTTGEILPAVSAIISKNRISVVPGEKYCFVKPSGVQSFGVFYDSNNNPVQYIAQTGDASAYNLAVTFGPSTDYKFTVPSGATNMLFRIDNITVYSNNVSVNYPSTDNDYHPYSGNQYTIQLGQTVYGGTLDVLGGVLTVDRAMVDLGTLTWTFVNPIFYVSMQNYTPKPKYQGELVCSLYVNRYVPLTNPEDMSVYMANSIDTPILRVADSRYTDATAFKQMLTDNNAQLVYELATPITYQLTPTEVTTLLGQNNIWADTGDVDVEYLKQTLMHIGSTIRPPHYGCVWDQEHAQMRRTGLARTITTNTQNFKHSGSVNPNYDNPFDNIYPWSERKLCNISLTLYQALQPGDNIKDCVTYWENDDGFSYNDPDGVWVYTPEFWGTSYWIGSQRYFEVSPVELAGYHHYKEQISARWRGTTESRTIGGTSKTVLLSKPGLPIANTVLSTIHTYAKNGGMTLDSVYTLDASLLLYLVEYANYNAQSAIGNGVSDLYDQTTLHPDAAVTAGTTVQFTGLTSAQLADFIVGAIVDFGTTSGGAQTARTYITTVETASGVTTVTLADAITVTTDTFVSIHGRINYADADIGSMSGYIGTNGKSDAYYRGEALWGNMFFYTLGAYKSDTEHVWLAEEGTEDNYDAINTSVHTDTGIVLTGSTGYIKKLEWPDSLGTLFACALCTEVGGSNSNPVGDYFYTTTGSSRVLIVGGYASTGSGDGPFCWRWAGTASNSSWGYSGRPRLKSP